MFRRRRKLILWLVGLLVVPPAGARIYVHTAARSRLYTDIARVPDCRVALVLGCKVHPNGNLSTLLKDRVDKAVELYHAGKVDKLLMSGDNRVTHYNEPLRMRDNAIAHGVAAENVSMDFAGRRTYDSVYRARHIWGLKRFIVVSQGFHVDRAVFLARRIGVDAYGVSADRPSHANPRAIIREMPACIGAVVDAYLRRPRPVMGKHEMI